MQTVNNFRVYDPRSPEFKRLLNHLQNGEVIEASKNNAGGLVIPLSLCA